jgi:hypothetical protein
MCTYTGRHLALGTNIQYIATRTLHQHTMCTYSGRHITLGTNIQYTKHIQYTNIQCVHTLRTATHTVQWVHQHTMCTVFFFYFVTFSSQVYKLFVGVVYVLQCTVCWCLVRDDVSIHCNTYSTTTYNVYIHQHTYSALCTHVCLPVQIHMHHIQTHIQYTHCTHIQHMHVHTALFAHMFVCLPVRIQDVHTLESWFMWFAHKSYYYFPN